MSLRETHGRQFSAFKARYTPPQASGRNPGKLHKYLEYRQDEQDPTHYERLDEDARWGNAEEFKEAAKEREQAGNRSAYMHIMISPENGHELTNDDYREIAAEWTTDKNGQELPYYAAVHRDTDDHHLHIAIARDKFQKADMEERKERTREVVMEQEQMRGIEPDSNRQRKLEQEREEQQRREQERQQREQERQQREQERRREAERGLEIER